MIDLKDYLPRKRSFCPKEEPHNVHTMLTIFFSIDVRDLKNFFPPNCLDSEDFVKGMPSLLVIIHFPYLNSLIKKVKSPTKEEVKGWQVLLE